MLSNNRMQLKLNDRHIEILSLMKTGACFEMPELIYKGLNDLMYFSSPEEMFLLINVFESEISSQEQAQTFSEGFCAYLTTNRGSEKIEKLIEVFSNYK